MKKNFFKKLSFVLALAMIISVIAPAAGAFAATKAPKLNSTKQYLHLAKDGADEYDFNITNSVKGWKYKWTSSNKKVATVASNGLTTATGVGTAKISVTITDKDGKKVGNPLKATVVVRDNIKDLTIYVQSPKDADLNKLAVATDYDFGRKFVTVAGSTTKTSGVTKWSVDKDTATISTSGVFNATEAGKYVITARAFQSTAKYTEWLASKDEKLVTATKTLEVTVVASIVEVKQVNLNTFTVEFDSNMSKTDVLTTAAVYQIINGNRVATGTEKIKKIELNSTGKVATVEMYTNLKSASEYNFVYGDLVGAFVGATKAISEIDGLVFADFDVNVLTGLGTDMLTKVTAVNKDGVAIYTGTEIQTYLTFTYGGDLAKGFTNLNMAYVYTEGYVAPVTVKFENYVFDEASKTYVKVSFEDAAAAVGVKTDSSLNTASLQYAVVLDAPGVVVPDKASTKWSTAATLAARDSYKVFVRSKNKDAAANADYTNDTVSRFAFESTNTDKLLVSGSYLFPIAQGTVTVIVRDTAAENSPIVGTFDVNIQAARTFVSATPDKASVSVGNDPEYAETAKVTITTRDSMTAPVAVTASASFDRKPAADAVVPNVEITYGAGDKLGEVYVEVTGATEGVSATKGAYNIKVEVSGLDAKKDVYFTAIVLDATTNVTVVKWAVELTSTSFDLKNLAAQATTTAEVYGYNSNNVRVDKLDASEFAIQVKKGTTDITTTNPIPVVGAEAGILKPYEVGTYVVTATVAGATIVNNVSTHPTVRNNGAYIGAATFTVSDTTTKEVIRVNSVVAADTVLAMVKAAYDFKLNGTAIANDEDVTGQITKVTYSKGATTLLTDNGTVTTLVGGESVYVSSIEYTVENGVNDTVYTINIGATIAAAR